MQDEFGSTPFTNIFSVRVRDDSDYTSFVSIEMVKVPLFSQEINEAERLREVEKRLFE